MSKSIYARFETSGKKLELIQDVLPELKEGEILVKNTFTTLCRSDLYTYKGVRKEKSPTILGHEITGYIVAFGPNYPKFDNRGEKLKLECHKIAWESGYSYITNIVRRDNVGSQKLMNKLEYKRLRGDDIRDLYYYEL